MGNVYVLDLWEKSNLVAFSFVILILALIDVDFACYGFYSRPGLHRPYFLLETRVVLCSLETVGKGRGVTWIQTSHMDVLQQCEECFIVRSCSLHFALHVTFVSLVTPPFSSHK